MSVRIITGDCRIVLPTLPADSFDCCVTSQPYFRQRDYGVDGQIGHGVTRNAVLGKMHRLGLSNRVKAPAHGRPKKARPIDFDVPPWVPAELHAEYRIRAARDDEEAAAAWARARKSGSVSALHRPLTPRAISKPKPVPPGRPHTPPPDRVAVPTEPVDGGVELVDLKSHHCRWPFGDGPPYRYCGARKPAEQPAFCEPADSGGGPDRSGAEEAGRMRSASSKIDPIEVVQPSPAVADATIRIVSDLVALRDDKGLASAEVEAMAMHNASLAFLRPNVGTDGVSRVLAIAAAENDKAMARDAVSQGIGSKRRLADQARAARRSPP